MNRLVGEQSHDGSFLGGQHVEGKANENREGNGEETAALRGEGNYFVCDHPSHTLSDPGDLHQRRYLRLSSGVEESTPPSITVPVQVIIWPDLLRDVNAGPAIGAWARIIQSRLATMHLQLCPHTNSGDDHMRKYFDAGHVDVVCFGKRYWRPQPLPGTCQHPDCTMSFWFRLEQASGGFSRAQDRRSELRLYVKRCALPLPIHAHREAWIGSSQPPE